MGIRLRKLKVEGSEDDAAKLIRTTCNLVAVLTVVVVLMFVLLIRMQAQLRGQDRELERLQTTAKDAKTTAIEASDKLSEVVEARAQADTDVSAAVRIIFSMYTLLCEQFPETTPCVGDG